MKNEKKTLLYISFKPINQRYIDRFCIDYFIKKGHKIYHIDISALFFVELNMKKTVVDFSYTFKDLNQLKLFFREEKLFNCIAVCSFGAPKRQNMNVYNLLKSYGSKLVFFDDGTLPTMSKSVSMLVKLKSLINPSKIINKILDILYDKINPEIIFDCFFTSGEISAKKYSLYNPIRFNNLDNNRYLKLSNNNKQESKKHIVFIDQNMVNHPDWKIMGKIEVDEESYYNKLNDFFSKVENQFKTEVIIATHPSADYKNNPFDNRKLVGGIETAKNTINCDFIITFFSTAINYAILKYKPILFINSNVVSSALPEPEATQCSKDFASRLDQNLINIDNYSEEIVINRNINKVKYDNYKYDYIVSKGNENILNEKLIENGFKNIK